MPGGQPRRQARRKVRSDPGLRNVSDTARWVAIYRAIESERPDALFRDPYARRLAGERGERIRAAMEFANRNAWSFVARTVLFDRFVTESIANGTDMIVNLAAGLDTRPYRMALCCNGSKWTCRTCSSTRPRSSLGRRRAASWSACRSTWRTPRRGATSSIV